ncbi:alpha/beta hydrolase [Companilactobacillus metriopterae]|uniref:alpha/beta hydrolase n=1 Tax=Companilactobacillus metriopterae TaxID=1909267 RepID=UPI0013E97DFF|nr:alpha/beta hydrolase [Companilactobacillus metriopterae]
MKKVLRSLLIATMIGTSVVGVNPLITHADTVSNIEAQGNYEKSIGDNLSDYLKSDKKVQNINGNSKRPLKEIEKIILAEAVYRFAFDNRVPWPQNPIQSDGPYMKEFQEASDWFVNSPKEQWTMPFTDRDGETKNLNAYYIKNPANTNKTVIIAHGYRMNALQMGGWAKIYYDMGYNILAPDARAHGASDGNAISYGWKEKNDYKNWADKIVENDPTSEIVITGVSMGGATTMMSSGVQDMPSNVKAYIEDCGYTSVYDQFEFLIPTAQYVIEQQTGLKISDSDMQDILKYVDGYLKSNQGFTLEQASSVDQLKNADKPMLFIHGGNDNFVPTNMVYTNYDAKLGNNKDIWVVPNTGHGMSIIQDLPGYQEHVKEFINNNI